MAVPTHTDQLFSRLKDASSRDLSSLTVLLAREYTSIDPECGIAWLMYGIALVETGRYDAARKALSTATRLCPSDKLRIPYAQIGHLYKQKGNLRLAQKWYQKTIEADSRDAAGYIFMGSVFALQGKLNEAIQCHRKATRCKRGCVDEAYLNLGLVLRAKGELQLAQTALRKAIELDPEYTAAREAIEDVNAALQFTRSQKHNQKRDRKTRRRTKR